MGNPESLWSCPVSLSLLTLWLYSFHLSALLLSVGSEHLRAYLSSHVFVPRVLVCLSHCLHLPLLSVCPAPCSICSPRIPLTLASSAFCLCSVSVSSSLSLSAALPPPMPVLSHRKERPCGKHSEKGAISNQRESPRQKLSRLHGDLDSSLQNCEKTNFFCLSHESTVLCCGSSG